VLTGRVLVDDVPVDKAGARVRPEARIRLRGERSRFVSRGGDKLAGALEDLALDPSGLRCLDVGASTGGFTDCLLQHGAAAIVAVDVGYGQLHPRLREDPRVRVLERTNARALAAEHLAGLDGPVDLAVIDASFISLRLLLPPVTRVAPAARVLALVKPQFEVGRDRVGKGGVVRDDADRRAAAEQVVRSAAELGYRLAGQVDSRLAGPKGNREIFLLLVPPGSEARGAGAA
jgi:23S rRNA (cytidine1920-2'-O)/16S rRNA (cytidine1409-2'-O)-methyltransferase